MGDQLAKDFMRQSALTNYPEFQNGVAKAEE